MTGPRPDEERLRTADLANAAERPAPPEQSNPDLSRSAIERDVTPPPGTAADMARPYPGISDDDGGPATLFASDEAEDLRRRWTDVQTAFVDEPRQAVERADELVATVIKRLATIFADERANLERQWDRGGDVSTEDLRVSLRRYRGFFDRLLSV